MQEAGKCPLHRLSEEPVLQLKHLYPHHKRAQSSAASNCLQPTALSPFPHPGEDNNGIMQVPALGKKLLRRDLTAAFLAYPGLLILPGILTHQRCDGGQQDIILDDFLWITFPRVSPSRDKTVSPDRDNHWYIWVLSKRAVWSTCHW